MIGYTTAHTHAAAADARIRNKSKAGMECLIEQGREQAKWTVICGVLIHLRMLSLLLTSFSLGGLSSTVLPRLPTHCQFSLSISHRDARLLHSLTCLLAFKVKHFELLY